MYKGNHTKEFLITFCKKKSFSSLITVKFELSFLPLQLNIALHLILFQAFFKFKNRYCSDPCTGIKNPYLGNS